MDSDDWLTTPLILILHCAHLIAAAAGGGGVTAAAVDSADERPVGLGDSAVDDAAVALILTLMMQP